MKLRVAVNLLLLLLSACASGPRVLPPSTTVGTEAIYAALYPLYAEICALSAMNKKPGFGAQISSGIGGHAILYLNGVCRSPTSEYPVLVQCNDVPGKAGIDGVGISVNAHYANANWVAVEGRDFFFDGRMTPGQALTREAYAATLQEARAKKIFEGVSFHKEVFDDMPDGFTQADFKYEISTSTDFAIAFGRNRYCGRVPMNAAQMQAMIAYMNSLNEPYRSGQAVFDWNIITDNCAHVNHNALAAAHIWDIWETGRFILVSIFDFPVPKNEFVNLVQRVNDMPIDDPLEVYRDDAARLLLMTQDRLPTQPGAIIDLGRVISQNDIYETDSPIIFYDDPITGRYRRRYHSILTEPRYFDLRENLTYFAKLYDDIKAKTRPLESYYAELGSSQEDRREFAVFYEKYNAYISRISAEVTRKLAQLDRMTGYAKAS